MDKRKNNGGRREGAGRPPVSTKRKSLTIRLDEDTEKIVESEGNKSAFINDCIRNRPC